MTTSRATQPITVLGAGSWGTALAIHLAQHRHQPVRLWDVNAEHIKTLQTQRVNQRYLPQCELPENVELFDDLARGLKNTQDVLCVVPSHAFCEVITACQPHMSHNARLIWATKGIDPYSHTLLSEVAESILGNTCPLAVLSGPSFAREVAMGMPTAVVIASQDKSFQDALTERFNTPRFRVYHSEDLVGVQLGGALKNIFAIAAGMSDGLGFGTNARCALISRSLAEMMRLGLAMGAQQKTFMGLSGLGDLVLTCTDNQSRNRRFGLALGQGKTIQQAEAEIDQVIEGKGTAIEALTLAKHYQIEMPITEQVQQVILGQLSAYQAFQKLLSREVTDEF